MQTRISSPSYSVGRLAAIGLFAGIALPACIAPQTPEARIVTEAATALGGVRAVQDVQTMTMQGEGEVFALGQNREHDGPLLKWQVTGYSRAVDFRRARWRDEFTQTAAFVTGWPDPTPVIAGYADDLAFDIEEGQPSRLDPITARDRRAELFHHPIGFLQAALAPGARLEPVATEGNEDVVTLVAGNGDRFTLHVDRHTHLPQRIVSKSHVAALGDVTVETTFGAFISPGATASGTTALKVPSRITSQIDGTTIRELRVTSAAVGPLPASLGDLSAPEAARTATSSPPRVTVEEVAPGIWYLAGEGHHSVAAEFADHLVLIEAPVDETRTLAVIARARALRPGKPLTQVVNTHHHFDHSGGIRAAIAEGLTVITHEANRSFYERMAARPATVAPDALAKRPKPLAIETVSDKKVLADRTRSLEIYPVSGSPHCASMLMIYFPREQLLVEADAYQPPPLAGPPPRIHPFAANLLDNIQARALRIDRILPLHGRIVAFPELVAAAAARPSAPVR